MPKRIKVTEENSNGRNTQFHDNFNGNDMSAIEFVSKIEAGDYSNYHVRVINDVKTPVSNPDPSTNNNLN